MKKVILSIITILTISIGLNAQIVNIPDANFKASLVGNSSINTNGDTEIQVSEATAFTGTVSCVSSSISDLTGIEAFTNITYLRCQDNALTSLDVSYNTALIDLRCQNNQLTSFDLSSNTSLQILDCSNNLITSLDLSSNTILTEFTGYNNALTYLNVANTYNIYFNVFYVVNNPNLTCIEVDDVAWSDANWSSGKDATASFSLNCPVLVNSISVQGQANISTITTNGGTLQMEATVLPATADDATYTWSVANGTGSASISATGLLTASADGTVTVTATANDASGETGTTTITISNQNPAILVSSIVVQIVGGGSTITTPGGTLQFAATVFPGNADDDTYTWSVVNGSGSATISTTGLLTATADGTVEVIATANDASGVTGIRTITISNQSNNVILVNEITIGTPGGTTTISTNGGTLQMSATVLPATADDVTYTWSVVNGTGSATIDANGLLTATGNGTVTVTATANDGSGETATFEITITNQSVGINDLAFENISVYPNPTNGIINLNISETLSSIRIMDLTGKTVQVYNAKQKQLNISNFTSGIYFLEIANAEKKSIVKIIKK